MYWQRVLYLLDRVADVVAFDGVDFNGEFDEVLENIQSSNFFLLFC